MERHCPFMNETCKEEKCQLWVAFNQINSGCAIQAIPLFLERDLKKLSDNIEILLDNKSGNGNQ